MSQEPWISKSPRAPGVLISNQHPGAGWKSMARSAPEATGGGRIEVLKTLSAGLKRILPSNSRDRRFASDESPAETWRTTFRSAMKSPCPPSPTFAHIPVLAVRRSKESPAKLKPAPVREASRYGISKATLKQTLVAAPFTPRACAVACECAREA